MVLLPLVSLVLIHAASIVLQLFIVPHEKNRMYCTLCHKTYSAAKYYDCFPVYSSSYVTISTLSSGFEKQDFLFPKSLIFNPPAAILLLLTLFLKLKLYSMLESFYILPFLLPFKNLTTDSSCYKIVSTYSFCCKSCTTYSPGYPGGANESLTNGPASWWTFPCSLEEMVHISHLIYKVLK
jgi:hypothetical protein